MTGPDPFGKTFRTTSYQHGVPDAGPSLCFGVEDQGSRTSTRSVQTVATVGDLDRFTDPTVFVVRQLT